MQTLSIKAIRGQRGFTLVEIMITLSILTIIASIGTTSLMNYLPGMRLRSAARDIYSTILLAKTEAVRRGENVTVLFNSPGNSYTMFVDRDNNDLLDPGETVLVSATVLPTSVSYDPAVGAGDGVSFNDNTAVYTRRGIPTGSGNGKVGLRVTDSLGNTIKQTEVIVSLAGRINIQ